MSYICRNIEYGSKIMGGSIVLKVRGRLKEVGCKYSIYINSTILFTLLIWQPSYCDLEGAASLPINVASSEITSESQPMFSHTKCLIKCVLFFKHKVTCES